MKASPIILTFHTYLVTTDRLRMDAGLNYTVPNSHESSNRAVTLNTSVSYENKKGKITYSLEGKNLLNQQNVGLINNTDFSTTSSSQSLFERYFLFTVRFRF